MKISKKPVPLIYPNSVILVTTIDENDRPNIITLTLVGALCYEPPIIGIGIGKKQFSKGLVEKSREFVINIPSVDLLRDVEHCGLVSGRDIEKEKEVNFKLAPSIKVNPPLITECPVNMECRVVEGLPLGSNVLFLGEVVYLHVDQSILDSKGGIDLLKAQPILFNLTNSYWRIGEKLADYGFTISRTKVE